MSKRLIEFNCGDPKSNQQTASKVDCKITINNVPSNKKPNSNNTNDNSNKQRKPSKDIKITEGIEIFNDDTDSIESAPITGNGNNNNDNISNNGDEFNARVNVPVKTKLRAVPSSTERYLMVSKQPIVTTEEIENNIEFHKRRAEILTHALCLDDKKLLANLIDTTGKVIVSAQEFCELIALMLSSDEVQVSPSNINLTLQEEYISSCLKVQVSPFKKITSIKINNQDFYNIQNEAYNALTDIYKISVDTVYVVPLTPVV